MNFVAPFFLYGLISLSIPIIIHLVELRKARKILFTNVAFINQVRHITSNHRRLKEILILICRLGFITFLVLLFAQPFIPAKKQILQNFENTKIFLDNSFSMQNESEYSNSNLLETSVASIKKVVKLMGENERISYLDHSGLSNVHTNYSKTKLNDFLNQVKFSVTQKSLSTVLYDFNANSTSPYTALVYSDFQRNISTTKNLQALKDQNQYYLVQVKGTATKNAFIDSVYIEDEFIRVNQLNKIQVKVRNSGVQEIKNCQVKFYIGEEQVSALSIQVAPKQTTTFTLNYRLSDTEPKNCRINLQDYPLDFDNDYFFTLKASAAINIVDVAAGNNRSTERLFTSEPIFKYNHITPAQFNYTLLTNTNLLILNSLEAITPAFADNLNEFVKNGGSLAIIPHAAANGKNLEQILQKLNISNVRMGNSTAGVPEQYDLALPDRNNPFFRNIFEQENPKMQMPKAARVLTWSRASVDILKFRDNNKFLSQFNRGKGKVYLFSAPLQEQYTSFINHALFVPVLYKIAMQSYLNRQNLAYTLGQKNIYLPITNRNNKEVYKLIKDSIEYIPTQQIREGQLVFSVPAEIQEGGFYQLKAGNATVAQLALNLPKSESELNFYSTNELKDITEQAGNVHIMDVSDELSFKNLFNQENTGTHLWKYCLILCLLFALAEILLIRFM